MALLSILAALLIEQWRPLPRRNSVVRMFEDYAARLSAVFNGGERWHGMVAWLLAVLLPVVIGGGIYYLLNEASPALALLWNVLVLYLTMGLRQFSHAFTAIVAALSRGDLDIARELLQEWRGLPTNEFNRVETARVSIEHGLIYSHRYVFGIIFWFIVLPGPIGAILYRCAALLNDQWANRTEPGSSIFGGERAFGNFAAQAFEMVDWLPVRLTAISFAIVGDFEDAIYCWRSQALSWAYPPHGIVLSSGAGALGVRLGEALHEYGSLVYRPEIGVGDEADVGYMQSTVGLIWRALVLWLLLLFLVAIANWVGGA
ncbi:MAG: CobD/CbiB family protein [Pseudomonadota bacterium]|nr:CobD/CbiB family protein [Burkholderiales bacterium]MDQ3197158.1 CobD/CbiB family protein [Pseudomonadota bacterium]